MALWRDASEHARETRALRGSPALLVNSLYWPLLDTPAAEWAKQKR